MKLELAEGDVLINNDTKSIIVVVGINNEGTVAFTKYVPKSNSLEIRNYLTWSIKSILENWTKVEI